MTQFRSRYNRIYEDVGTFVFGVARKKRVWKRDHK